MTQMLVNDVGPPAAGRPVRHFCERARVYGRSSWLRQVGARKRCPWKSRTTFRIRLLCHRHPQHGRRNAGSLRDLNIPDSNIEIEAFAGYQWPSRANRLSVVQDRTRSLTSRCAPRGRSPPPNEAGAGTPGSPPPGARSRPRRGTPFPSPSPSPCAERGTEVSASPP